MQTLGSRQLYANPWLTIREDAVRRADGSDGVFAVVDKPTYALIVPLDGHRLHLVEQHRYPLGARRWEFPQGTAPDRAELDPQALAARELREETGLVAAEWTVLGTLDVAPGMSSQRGRVYLATGLTEGPPERELEEQDMVSGWWTRTRFEDAVRNGAITDSQSIAAYAQLLLHERAHQPQAG